MLAAKDRKKGDMSSESKARWRLPPASKEADPRTGTRRLEAG